VSKRTNIPKICHLYWGKDRPLSWLRWLTAKTFASLNPDWQVIAWYPKQPGLPGPWKTKEHSYSSWEGEDWFKRLPEAGPNVEIREAPIGDFPLLSEVHRSDLLRWRLLHTMGGFWSDFDIIYFRPMKDLTLDMTADALLCWGETEELKNWQAIGFLAGAPGSPLFKDMFEVGFALAKAPRLDYQELGTHLLCKFVPPKEIRDTGYRVGQIPMHAVYPFETIKSQMPALWKNYKILDVRESTIGVHWFAGQELAGLMESSWSSSADVEKERRLGGVRWALEKTGIVAPFVPGIRTEYSIIMPYLDRATLLHNSLLSFSYWYSDRDDWEVIIVKDSKCSKEDKLSEVVAAWRQRGIDIRIVEQKADDCYGPSKLFNQGVAECQGQYVILTSPEVFHNSDILEGLDLAFDDDPNQYVVCACQSLGRVRVGMETEIKRYNQLRGQFKEWFQHSIHRPAKYHFCSALKKELYLKAGGFDEDYALGFCFDDDDFRDSIIEVGITLSQRDDLLTSHQWHVHCNVPDKKVRWDRNLKLYESKHGTYHSITMSSPPAKLAPAIVPSCDRSGSPKVTIVCVLKSGGAFTPDYVTKLYNMVERNTTQAYEFICLTDFPKIKDCQITKLLNDFPGWWSKIELFRPGLASTEKLIYFDLDTIILGNIDAFFEFGGEFYGLRPWNRGNQLRGQFGSGVMAWKSDSVNFIYNDFDISQISPHFGDQAYISRSLTDNGVNYQPLQDVVSGIYSYKRECSRKGPPSDARIICFHGRPRVHEVNESWVHEAWR